MATQKVTKAVIPAAGFGTRFLPQTKAMPKEMLPIVDKPIIQYVVEQLVEAGIKDIIIVGSSNKRAIEDHFDMPSEDLLINLRAGGTKKQPYIDQIEAVADLANFVYVRQKGIYGSATPIANAAHLIGDEPFIYAFPDFLVVAEPNIFQQMIAAYEKHGSSIVASVRVSEDKDYDQFGILGGEMIADDVMAVTKIVEKPGKDFAPSDLGVGPGYLFTPDVLPYAENGWKDLPAGQEFFIPDFVLQPMLDAGKPLHGLEITFDNQYDTGNPLGYMKTVIDFALAREDIGQELRDYLQKRLTE
jgi:UTP--glucose-1-phosphate uridylyltransferase